MTEVPTVGLSFIFRDDVATIGPMLDSLLPHVDQIVAVDTGSSDGSRAIVDEKLAQHPGATLVDHDWPGRGDPATTLNDFAAARQTGWSLLTTDWGLWADADDVVENAELLRRAAVSAQVGGPDAFICPYNYAQTPAGACICTLNRERLIRSPQRWHWISPVHEVLAANDFQPTFVYLGEVTWRHCKQPKPLEGDRNLTIIEAHIADAKKRGVSPDPRMVVYLGWELAGRGRHEEAVEAYKQYMAIATWGEEKHQALHRMADSLRALGSQEEAIQVESYAMTHAAQNGVPEWADHLFGVGECLMGMSQPAAAIPWFERGLKIGMPASGLILNPRDYDYMPHFNLAVCKSLLGDHDAALEHLKVCHQAMPGDPGCGEAIGKVLRAKSESDAVKATKTYLETLVRFDENQKARQALDSLPYAAKYHPEIRALAHHIRTGTFQVGDPNGYARMYATNREVRNPDDFVENASEVFGRVATLVEGLREQAADGRELRMLDAGCNDGWVAAHVEGKLGLAVCDGIDLNPEAIEAAQARKERYGLKGDYQVGFVEESADRFGEGVYDAIAMFEVFEHLEDPRSSVEELERALKPGGRIYISTPIGAFEAGLVQNWQQNRAKQHLRAVLPNEFAQFALQRGRLTSFVMGVEGVQTLSYTPSGIRGRVVIWVGDGWEPWSPQDIDQRGLGGSETAVVKMAEGLVAAGWQVEVFGGLSAQGPIEGVLYRHSSEYIPNERCDIFISVRQPGVIDTMPEALHKVLWCHDAHVGGHLASRIDAFDAVYCLSETHERSLRAFEQLESTVYDEKFVRVRNGIDLTRWPDPPAPFHERAQTVIYSSSPDRGLERLLELWPQVLKRCPKAKLKVFYGFDVFDRMHASNPAMVAWKDELLAKAKKLRGVELRGRVDQKTLAAEQAKARVWAYPYPYENPTETSCITAMEAMAAGMWIVATQSGALPETLGQAGCVVGGSNEKFPSAAFVNDICAGLSDAGLFGAEQQIARERALQLDWESEAQRWSERFAQVGAGWMRTPLSKVG